MARHSSTPDFVRYCQDLLQTIGPVTAKSMFGGHGLFLNGRMFALVVKNSLYFKTNPNTEADFQQLGLEKFSYSREGKPAT